MVNASWTGVRLTLNCSQISASLKASPGSSPNVMIL